MKPGAKKVFVTAALAALLLPVNGCVEREEKIEVREDGSVSMTVEFTADAREELYAGRVPSRSEGWIIEESARQEADGKIRNLLTAKQEFPPLASLPESFAASDDPDGGLHLRFPTTLRMERRNDGTYYHFRRVYTGRPFACIENLKEMVGGNWILNMLEKDPKEMTLKERGRFIQVMVKIKMLEMLTHARAAYEDLTPGLQQDGWLGVRRGVLEILDGLDHERIARLLVEDDSRKEGALEKEAHAFEEKVKTRLGEGLLRFCGYREDQLKAFERLYRRHQRFHEITEDLGAEGFKITVRMPGEIVGANADEIQGGGVTWKFEGKLLRDRDHELMVTSRVRN